MYLKLACFLSLGVEYSSKTDDHEYFHIEKSETMYFKCRIIKKENPAKSNQILASLKISLFKPP